MYTPPQTWRSKPGKYRFIGSECSCGRTYFPRRAQCLCGNKTEDLLFSGSGVVESYTVIHNAPEGFVAPYAAGIIKTKEGPRVPAQLVGPVEKIMIGSPVLLCVRKIYEAGPSGMLVYGFKFEVVG